MARTRPESVEVMMPEIGMRIRDSRQYGVVVRVLPSDGAMHGNKLYIAWDNFRPSWEYADFLEFVKDHKSGEPARPGIPDRFVGMFPDDANN